MQTRNMLPLSLAFALALSGCATASRVPPEGPKPQPLPVELVKPVPVDFYSKMLNFCCEKQPEPTP